MADQLFYSYKILFREHQQQNFHHAWQILAIKGVGGFNESVIKGKFVRKIYSSDNVE